MEFSLLDFFLFEGIIPSLPNSTLTGIASYLTLTVKTAHRLEDKQIRIKHFGDHLPNRLLIISVNSAEYHGNAVTPRAIIIRGGGSLGLSTSWTHAEHN